MKSLGDHAFTASCIKALQPMQYFKKSVKQDKNIDERIQVKIVIRRISNNGRICFKYWIDTEVVRVSCGQLWVCKVSWRYGQNIWNVKHWKSKEHIQNDN